MSATPAYSPSLSSAVTASEERFTEARSAMIVSQLRTNRVYNEAVLDAFATVPREAFVAPAVQGTAYLDEDLPAGVSARYTMEPMVLARLLEVANIQPTEKVLLVGANGGYEAAILAKISKEVLVLEEDSAVLETATGRLENIDGITFIEGPLADGPQAEKCQAKGPFSVIIINGAITGIPKGFAKGLNDGGRLLAIKRPSSTLNGQATIIRCHQGNCASQPLFDANCPYLTGFEPVANTFTF